MADLHQTDIVGPRYLREPKRCYPILFFSLINRLSPCVDISLRHGDLWGFPESPMWIMRWLLQERVLRRHNCPNLAAFKRTSERFLQYYHYEKPHRSLTQKEHGTRLPGILRDRLWKTLRHLSKGFCREKSLFIRRKTY